RCNNISARARSIFGGAHAGASKPLEAIFNYGHNYHHSWGRGGILHRNISLFAVWRTSFSLLSPRSCVCDSAPPHGGARVRYHGSRLVYPDTGQGIYLRRGVSRSSFFSLYHRV